MLDALVGCCQGLLQKLFFGLFRAQLLQQLTFAFLDLAQLLFQLDDFFFLRLVLSIANKGLCEQYL
jgi:hypothetical protein